MVAWVVIIAEIGPNKIAAVATEMVISATETAVSAAETTVSAAETLVYRPVDL